MSKLSVKTDWVYVEKENWSFYTPFLKRIVDVESSGYVKYNVINGANNIAHLGTNVIHIGKG